ncbi:MAG: hypothetical protein ACT4N2_10135 [Hyphomicrobium sp.]
MCKPLKDFGSDFTNEMASLPPPEKIGSCGKRCRDCKLAAMAAGLIGPAVTTSRVHSGLQLHA